MKRALKHLLSNKTFYIFLVLTLFMFPDALFQQGDKARTAIVTTVGIDKVENEEYEVSVLTVIPKGASQLNANLELFSAKGKSIVKALDIIGDSLGKNIGLSHCDCIILAKSVLEEDVCKVLDYFIRNANMSNNASVIVAKDTSKELLEASKSANNLYDLTLKDIVKYSDDDNYNTGMNIESFYKDYYSFDSVSIIPLLELEKSDNSGASGTGSGGGEPSNTSSGSSSSSSGGESTSSSSKSGESKNVKNNGDSVVLINGKYENTLSNEENYIYNLLSPHTKHENITVTNVTDELVTNASETYRVVDKYNYRQVEYKNNKFIVNYYSYLVLKLEEVVTDHYELKTIENLEEYLTPCVKQKMYENVMGKFNTSVSEIKRTNQDILKVGREFYAYHTKEWQEYVKDNKDNYLENIEFNLHIDFAFKI